MLSGNRPKRRKTPAAERPVYYWESSIWIVYFNEGRQHPDVYEYLDEIFTLIMRDQVIIVTSVITRAELLESRLGPKNLRSYDDLFARKNIVDQPVTRAITMLASDYRSHFGSLTKAGKFADAIHLATAVDNKVDEMHTTDADDLLPCDGDQLLRGTRVVRPVSDLPKLFTSVTNREPLPLLDAVTAIAVINNEPIKPTVPPGDDVGTDTAPPSAQDIQAVIVPANATPPEPPPVEDKNDKKA